MNRDPIEEEGGHNLYGFVGNDGVNQVDVLGENALDLAILLSSGRLNKAWGLDVTGSVIVGPGVRLATQLVFFPSTRELALYGIVPAIFNRATEEYETPDPTTLEEILGILNGLPIGYDISLTANLTVAYYRGSSIPGPESWRGVFYGATFGGAFGLDVGVGGFYGYDDGEPYSFRRSGESTPRFPGARGRSRAVIRRSRPIGWVGGSIGGGVGLPGISFSTNPQIYYLGPKISVPRAIADCWTFQLP